MELVSVRRFNPPKKKEKIKKKRKQKLQPWRTQTKRDRDKGFNKLANSK